MFLCGSVVEHCVSSAKGCGFDSQGTHILELGGMTKNLYHGIFLNYTGFTVYDGINFFHA